MISEEQRSEIYELISQKQEGAYWDFKKEWYSKDKNGDMLHDIICMANNMEDRDAYIIIGVDEENDYGISGLSNSENRKNTQKIVDFLRDKKFAGGIRPMVYVETMNDGRGEIDVIVIKNGYSTPYHLAESYLNVNANNIYTRVFDTNTPKNKSAEISHVEYLWKKRFRLLSSPLEQVFYYLMKKEDWLDVPEDSLEMKQYYKYFPEYVVEHAYLEDRTGYEYYFFSQVDSRPIWYNICVRYHQTVLFSTIGVALDGGRYFTNVPCTDVLFNSHDYKKMVTFKYFVKRTKEHILHEFFYEDRGSDEAWARERFEQCVLTFYSEEEKHNFKKYAASKWGEREEYLKNIHVPSITLPESYNADVIKVDYENALILTSMLDEYRSC